MTELVWHDTATWGLEGKGWEDTARHFERLPARARESVREPVWDLSRFSAGLNLRFVTDSPQIHARYDLLNPTICMPHMPATSHSGLDLYGEDGSGFLRWVGIGITRPEGQHVEGALAEGLAPGRRPYCLYLPLYNSPETLEIGIEAGAHLEPLPPRDEKPILFYGTSILHGARAGMGIPAIVGRRLRRSVINLAFSGNGKMEPEIADLLAELDPCLFVVDCLPNIWSQRRSPSAPHRWFDVSVPA